MACQDFKYMMRVVYKMGISCFISLDCLRLPQTAIQEPTSACSETFSKCTGGRLARSIFYQTIVTLTELKKTVLKHPHFIYYWCVFQVQACLKKAIMFGFVELEGPGCLNQVRKSHSYVPSCQQHLILMRYPLPKNRLCESSTFSIFFGSGDKNIALISGANE